jgi:hypothetical protein
MHWKCERLWAFPIPELYEPHRIAAEPIPVRTLSRLAPDIHPHGGEVRHRLRRDGCEVVHLQHPLHLAITQLLSHKDLEKIRHIRRLDADVNAGHERPVKLWASKEVEVKDKARLDVFVQEWV